MINLKKECGATRTTVEGLIEKVFKHFWSILDEFNIMSTTQ